MIRRRRSLVCHSGGSATIEFAIAGPILIMMIFGMFQFGIVLQANAGVQHALGEAARYATIFPTPSDAELQARITSKKFGPGNGTWGASSITSGTGTKTISITYTQPLDWVFFTSTVTLNKSKVIYLSD